MRVFYRLMNMIDPPSVMVSPSMIWKVLKGPSSSPRPPAQAGSVSPARGA